MNLLLISTFPSSLELWHKQGILDREIEVYKRLSKLYKINIKLITFGHEGDLKYTKKLENIKVIPIFKNNMFNEFIFIKYLFSFLLPLTHRSLFREADIIKHNQFWGAWIGVIAKMIYKKKLIIRNGYDYLEFQKLYKRSKIKILLLTVILKVFFRFSDKIIVTTKEMKDRIKNSYNIEDKKIYIIANFIDTKLFKRKKNIKKVNDLLIVGRLTEQKNLNFIFKSLKNTKYTIKIIGEGDIKKYKSLANKYKLNINFIKKVENNKLPAFYNEAKIYILCSLYEGNPKTLLEAMACETPVIGSNVIGIREIIKNDENGFLIDLNSNKLIDYVDKIIGNDDIASYLGKNSRKHIENNNSIDVVIKKMIKLYRS